MKRLLMIIGILIGFQKLWGLGIVLPEHPSQWENKAAEELALHCEKATGSQVPITRGILREKRNIFLGSHPRFAAGLSPRKYQKEEWQQQAFSSDELLITGGQPRGILYGVYDFLETQLDVLWMDEWSTHVPYCREITWPEDLNRTGKPSFPYRGLYIYFGAPKVLRHRFLARNRQNHFHDERFTAGDAWDRGVVPVVGSPRSCHTFYNYTCNWGPEFEKCFSWSESQKKYLRAVTASGPGQICYTSPTTRKLFLQQLKKYIEKDRRTFGLKAAPVIYSITCNDNDSHCECRQCRSVTRKYGRSGLVLSFVNHLARQISGDYPEISLMTFAYMNAKAIPLNGLRPEPNVIIQMALLGGEYSGEHRNTHRSYRDPFNRESAELIRQWGNLGRTAIWDYWCLNAGRGNYPTVNDLNIADSLRFYHQNHVSFVFAECADAVHASFYPLRTWLGLRLMNDITLNEHQEIRRFLKAFFGPAAQEMERFHNLITAANNSLTESVCDLTLRRRTDLNDHFFSEAEKMLTAAEKKTAGQQEYLQRIQREWIPVYSGMIARRAQLRPISPQKLKFIAGRLQQFHRAAVLKYIHSRKQQAELRQMDHFISGAFNSVPTLKGFEHKDVIADFAWPELSSHRNTVLVNDPDAAGGKAVAMKGQDGTGIKEDSKMENRGIHCGVYNYDERIHLIKNLLPPQALPTDEQYHWYYAGRITLSRKCFLWMHWTWLSQQQLGGLYDTSGLNNIVDIYLSVKVAGPLFVRNSTEKNMYAIDRVVVCRASNRQDACSVPLEGPLRSRICVFDLKGLSLPECSRIRPQYDPDAPGGSSLNIGKLGPHRKNQFAMGLYNAVSPRRSVRLTPEIPQDEKYHYYSLGIHKIPQRGYIYAHNIGYLRVDMKYLYNRTDADRNYEIILAVKVQGPAYVQGSKRSNDISIGRVLLLAPDRKK